MSVEQHAAWARDRVTRILAAGVRERLVAVIVTSLDGAMAVDGRSRNLSSDQDRALVGAWREAADALLVGVPTLMAEVYGGGLFDPAARARRSARGAPPTPPVITIDRSASLDVDHAMRAKEPLKLVAYVPQTATSNDQRAVWVPRTDLTLSSVVADARQRFGHELIVAEPGPTLLRALREQRLLTDLSWTMAPLLTDHGPRTPEVRSAPPMRAVDVEVREGVIFLHLQPTRGRDAD
ncbi:MAG: dihydrofolate reductase family protein [Solirubrobacteraceae bacterium]